MTQSQCVHAYYNSRLHNLTERVTHACEYILFTSLKPQSDSLWRWLCSASRCVRTERQVSKEIDHLNMNGPCRCIVYTAQLFLEGWGVCCANLYNGLYRLQMSMGKMPNSWHKCVKNTTHIHKNNTDKYTGPCMPYSCVHYGITIIINVLWMITSISILSQSETFSQIPH